MLTYCIPWPDEDAARWRRLGLWEDITLCQVLEQTARRLPDKIALVHRERRIAKFKLPERLEIIERFPVSPAGKILRRRLRERIAAALASEAAAQIQPRREP